MEFIRWKDHSSDLLSSITELYQNDQLIDCMLDTEGGLVKGHSAILAACSPYLKRLIMDHQGIKRVPLKQVNFKDMKHIMDFIYYGEVGVPLSDLASLMKAAEFLQITSLTCLSSKVAGLFTCNVTCEPSMNNGGILLNKPNATFDSSGSNDSIVKRTEDLEMKFESICDDSEHDIKPEKLFMSVVNSETCETEELNIIEKDEQMEDSLLVSKAKLQDEWVSVQRISLQGMNPFHQMKIDNENLASEEKMYSFEGTVLDNSVFVKHEMKHAEETYEDVKLDPFSIVWKSDDSLEAGIENSSSGSPEGSASNESCLQVKSEDEQTTDHKGNSSSVSAAILKGKRHSKNVDSSKSIHLCELCGLIFETSKLLNVHLRVHNGEKVIQTKRSAYKKTYLCHLCSAIYRSACSFQIHLRRHEGEKPFSCHFCESAFISKKYLKVHLFKHTKDYPFICSVCGSGFALKSYLKKHQKVHSNEKPFSCTLCAKSFKCKTSCEIHILNHSGEVLPKKSNNFSCDLCEYTCQHLSTLKIHQRKHTGEKPYLCHYCEASFTSKGGLEYHIRIHTGEKPHSCDKCDATFSQKGNLLRHLKTHTGEKGKFVCDVCQKMFRDKTCLKAHLISHSGEQQFSCHICQGKFKHKSTLRSHMRTHTGERPYMCKFCGESFNHSSVLWRHLRIHK